MTRCQLRAADLEPGDFLPGSGDSVVRVVRDGVYARGADDSRTRTRWPKGHVEIKLATGRVAYWRRGTRVTVER